jgi:hypothetical protein
MKQISSGKTWGPTLDYPGTLELFGESTQPPQSVSYCELKFMYVQCRIQVLKALEANTAVAYTDTVMNNAPPRLSQGHLPTLVLYTITG